MKPGFMELFSQKPYQVKLNLKNEEIPRENNIKEGGISFA